MKAKITFFIGLAVTLLSTGQFLLTFSPMRLIGITVGLFFIIFGWKIGWTKNRKFTTLIGHIALTVGCLVSAYAVYQIPFIENPPSILEVFNMPLFWGIFAIFGGFCMITHGYCSCAVKMYENNNCRK